MKNNGSFQTQSIGELTPDRKNANKGTARGRRMVADSLKSYGAGRSILIDRNGNVIAGNKTLEGASAAGLEEVIIVPSDGTKLIAVQRTDLDIDDKRARELAIADNRAAQVGLEWDLPVLAEFEKADVGLGVFWSPQELDKLLAGVRGETYVPEPQIDKAAELQAKWGTERGQLWLIGPHRLLCGDSASREDVARLWANVREPDALGAMMATDPPYGVAYGVDSGADSAQRFGGMAGDGASGPQLQTFLEAVFQAAIPHLRPDAAWYLWHAQLTQGFFAAAAAAAAQLLVHRQIIWVKNHFILSHGDYHWQHELCFYGWREGYEPFAGSGTQLCAAESNRRRCYAIEIEPKYVSVALERMLGMGVQPVLANG